MMVNAFKKNTFSAPQLGSTHLLGKSEFNFEFMKAETQSTEIIRPPHKLPDIKHLSERS